MFDLTALTGKTYYIESPAKIGVWCPDGVHAWFIDSGNDKDAGRKLRKILDQQGWQLQGILIPTPTPTTSAATNICSGRPDAVSSPEDWKRPLRHIQSWNHHSCMAAIP